MKKLLEPLNPYMNSKTITTIEIILLILVIVVLSLIVVYAVKTNTEGNEQEWSACRLSAWDNCHLNESVEVWNHYVKLYENKTISEDDFKMLRAYDVAVAECWRNGALLCDELHGSNWVEVWK